MEIELNQLIEVCVKIPLNDFYCSHINNTKKEVIK